MQYRLLLTVGLITFTGVVEAHSNQYKVKVLDIEPVYQYVSIEKPVQYCTDHNNLATSSQTKRMIAGSVVGGTLGHLSSSRENRKNATLLGVVIGGVIGSKLGENTTYTKTSAHCITRYEKTEKVRVISGYHYWYKINGHTYQAYSVDKPQPYVILRKN